MTSKDIPDWNIGYTTKEHLCLDLDDTSLLNTESVVNMIIHDYPETGSVLILQSSEGRQSERWIYPVLSNPTKYVNKHNYHAIFNGLIPYEASCKIIECLAYLDVINKEYVRIREMRNDMTIRVSKTVNVLKIKPKPRIIEYIYNPSDRQEKGGIYRFMRLWKLC